MNDILPAPSELSKAFVARRNGAQMAELQRIKRECRWYVGERLGYDPMSTVEGRQEVELYFVGVISSGAGAWLADKIRREQGL
jgi:hypothetical protein